MPLANALRSGGKRHQGPLKPSSAWQPQPALPVPFSVMATPDRYRGGDIPDVNPARLLLPGAGGALYDARQFFHLAVVANQFQPRFLDYRFGQLQRIVLLARVNRLEQAFHRCHVQVAAAAAAALPIL